MLVLVLSTSTPAVTAGVVEVTEDTRLLAAQVTVGVHQHGELLAPSISAGLDQAGVTVHGLGAVVCDVGPGPFTGLRVGIVTAAAVADALSIPAYAVCGLDALGDEAPAGPPLLAATDARRHEIYWATYTDGVRTAGPDVALPAAVAASTAAQRAVGDGAERYADVLRLPVGLPRYPAALHLARVAAERVRAQAPAEVLTPLYLRRPDAVVSAKVSALTSAKVVLP